MTETIRTNPVGAPDATNTIDIQATEAAGNEDAFKLPPCPDSVTFPLGGRTFTVRRLNWGKLRKLGPMLGRIGAAMSEGRASDPGTLDEMTAAIALGIDIPEAELDALPAEPLEINYALMQLIRVTGLDRYQMSELRRLRELAAEMGSEAVLRDVLARALALRSQGADLESLPGDALP